MTFRRKNFHHSSVLIIFLCFFFSKFRNLAGHTNFFLQDYLECKNPNSLKISSFIDIYARNFLFRLQIPIFCVESHQSRDMRPASRKQKIPKYNRRENFPKNFSSIMFYFLFLPYFFFFSFFMHAQTCII